MVLRVNFAMKNQLLPIPTPLYIYDTESFAILAINDAFTNHYGYTEKEALTLHLLDLFPESEREFINKQKKA